MLTRHPIVVSGKGATGMRRTVLLCGIAAFLAAWAGTITGLAFTGPRAVGAQETRVRADQLAVVEHTISLDAANAITTAAVVRARELGQAVSVVVVDGHGLQKAMVRMDGALVASVNVAHGKAYTAAVRRETTEDYGLALLENPRLLHSIASVQPHMFLTPGGIPIYAAGTSTTGSREEQIIGAVGVGGAPRGLDLPIATAGLAAIQ
jgi:uncharacterized protein GlcG (DUF336 family)